MSPRPHRHVPEVVRLLTDPRGHRVVLVSHCLLNQNTRYAGGATRPGAVTEAVDELMAAGFGLHQLPCPERLAWGGVLKRHTLRLYGSRRSPLYPVRGALMWAFVRWSRLVYRRLARQVAQDVADYERSGISVAGVVGIGASPSCGVRTTLDLRASMDVVASCPLTSLTTGLINSEAVLACRRPGQGMFIEALDRELGRRGILVPAYEHDLATELAGGTEELLGSPPAALLGL